MQPIKPLTVGKLKVNLLPRLLVACSKEEKFYGLCGQIFKLESLEGQQATLIFHSYNVNTQTSIAVGAINSNNVPILREVDARAYSPYKAKRERFKITSTLLKAGIKYTQQNKIDHRGKRALYSDLIPLRQSQIYGTCLNSIDSALMVKCSSWECPEHQCLSLYNRDELVTYLSYLDSSRCKKIRRQCMESAFDVYSNAFNYRRSIGMMCELHWTCLGKAYSDEDSYVFINDLGLLIANREHFQELNAPEGSVIKTIITNHSYNLLYTLSNFLSQRGGLGILDYILHRGPLNEFYTDEVLWMEPTDYIYGIILDNALCRWETCKASEYMSFVRHVASEIIDKDILDLDNGLHNHDTLVQMISEGFKKHITTNNDKGIYISPVFAKEDYIDDVQSTGKILKAITRTTAHKYAYTDKNYYVIDTQIPHVAYRSDIATLLNTCHRTVYDMSRIGHTWT